MDDGISCPSVNTEHLVPNLPLYVGLGPASHFPTNDAFTDMLSRNCHYH